MKFVSRQWGQCGADICANLFPDVELELKAELLAPIRGVRRVDVHADEVLPVFVCREREPGISFTHSVDHDLWSRRPETQN